MSDTLYYQLTDALDDANAIVSPAEVHGSLCGMLSFSSQLDVNTWLSFILDQSTNKPSSIDNSTLEPALVELQEETEFGFSQDSGGMPLLLPPDEESMNERLEALAAWCEGFLFGVGLTHQEDSESSTLSETALEFITDVREISRLDTDSDDDEAEHYYMELVEYLRVGLLVFREETLPNAIMPHHTSATKH